MRSCALDMGASARSASALSGAVLGAESLGFYGLYEVYSCGAKGIAKNLVLFGWQLRDARVDMGRLPCLAHGSLGPI